jgi:formylglycine-generating enzyme required for sulfatase activity
MVVLPCRPGAGMARITADTREPEARVFISYSRKDLAFADRLDATLKARGLEALIDRTEIYSFEDWWKRIQALIGEADTVIFVLSPDAVDSDICRKEVAYAASLNKRFAPIVCRPVDASKVPPELSRLNFISFEDDPRFESNADKLAQALSTDIEWIRRHTELGVSALNWERANKPRGLLLRSPALDAAERWIDQQPQGAPSPTASMRAFIADSRKAENLARARARRTRAVLSILVVMLIAAGIGWWKQDWLKEQYQWRVTMGASVLTSEVEHALRGGAEFSDCKKGCPIMVVIPPGKFTMGSPVTEKGRGLNEGPQHEVAIAKPFAVGKYDITFAEWDLCVEAGHCPHALDEGWGRGDRPVINVSWDEAKLYAAWLSRMTAKDYRLLSEAEWEYAARAGTTTAYYWRGEVGKSNANCNGCGSQWDDRQTAPVGSFKPNAFGLYDMAGNVSQWLEDCFHRDYDKAPKDGSAQKSGDCQTRVNRGGSWLFGPTDVRTAARNWGSQPDSRQNDRGFRIARVLSQ